MTWGLRLGFRVWVFRVEVYGGNVHDKGNELLGGCSKSFGSCCMGEQKGVWGSIKV